MSLAECDLCGVVNVVTVEAQVKWKAAMEERDRLDDEAALAQGTITKDEFLRITLTDPKTLTMLWMGDPEPLLARLYGEALRYAAAHLDDPEVIKALETQAMSQRIQVSTPAWKPALELELSVVHFGVCQRRSWMNR